MPGLRAFAEQPATKTWPGACSLDTTTGAFSATFWFLSHNPNTCSVFGMYNSTNGELDGVTICSDYSDAYARFMTFDASSSQKTYSASKFWLWGQWAHYAVVWDGVRVQFWRSGQLHSSAAHTKVPTANGTRVTVLAVQTGAMNGALYDLRIFPNRTLTPGEVRATSDPRSRVSGCKGRYAVLGAFGAAGASDGVLDFSGEGNNLDRSSASTVFQCEEPPWRSMLVRRGEHRTARRRYANPLHLTVDEDRPVDADYILSGRV